MNRVLPVSLLLAWAVHDAEEWMTGAAWVNARWGERVSTRQVRTAIMVMAVLVGVASVGGAMTRGRSPAYRIAAGAFGIHGLGHLAISAAVRGYSPGVLTTPIAVLPYAVVATRAANRAYGPLRRRVRVLGFLGLPASLALAHGLAWISNRTRGSEGSSC